MLHETVLRTPGFARSSSKSPEEIEQWGRVLHFKNDFPNEGLWWPYHGADDFEKIVYDHLTRLLLDKVTAYDALEQATSRQVEDGQIAESQVRLKNIELKNIRCFEHINLNLCPGEHSAPWSLILGDNDVGKTTLLRSIALGLSPPNVARALFIVHLRRTGDHVEARSGLKPPRGFRADQVLTSYLFGLETTSDDQTRHEIERLSTLLSKEDRTRAPGRPGH